MRKAAGVLDGRRVAERRLSAAAKKIERLQKIGVHLTLATVQVGDTKDAVLYFQSLGRLLKKVNIGIATSVSSGKISEQELRAKILKLNGDPAVTGIMVFAPLPPHIDGSSILDAMDQLKDVEGRTFMKSHFGVFSPTANAVLAMIEEAHLNLSGKEAVVVGHSDLVGKPTAILLMDKFATVTVCHIKTADLRSKIGKADIVVAAAGRPNLVKGSWIKRGAVVIDVGENVIDGKLTGDVEFEAAKERAAFISPVPGGVGPLTNVMLIENLIRLHELRTRFNGSTEFIPSESRGTHH